MISIPTAMKAAQHYRCSRWKKETVLVGSLTLSGLHLKNMRRRPTLVQYSLIWAHMRSISAKKRQ